MPKGKYAARAANRREAAEAESTEAGYRRQIVRLTEERNQARAERDEALADWNKEVRILRAQLSEGTSPRVEALTRELNRIREERDESRRYQRESRDRYAAAIKRLTDHMVSDHGMSVPAAREAVFELFIGRHITITEGIEKRVGNAFGTDAVLALRKARGQ